MVKSVSALSKNCTVSGKLKGLQIIISPIKMINSEIIVVGIVILKSKRVLKNN
jgi:hypothetical protein